jgi:hypothetical protein
MKPLGIRLSESLHRTLEGFRDEVVVAELDEEAADCLDALAEQFVLRNGLTIEEARGVVAGALLQPQTD